MKTGLSNKDYKMIGVLITIPFVLAIPPMVGWWLGDLLDKKLDTAPYLMYLLIFLGIVAAIREFIRIIKRYVKNV